MCKVSDEVGDWVATGICPGCGKRSLTGGRCLYCDWKSKSCKLTHGRNKLEATINARIDKMTPEIFARECMAGDMWKPSERSEYARLSKEIEVEERAISRLLARAISGS